ncbi:MAG: GGDEF domain-containing protein [Rubrivivax sp.]|nr:GGDEF domain-containing protein [Rubrivivax sp.]
MPLLPVTPGTPVTAATVAKAALRRLAQAQLEPTPENYARAYADEGGAAVSAFKPAAANAMPQPRSDGPAWAQLIERLAKNLQRGGKQWTVARRKDSLQRVLDSSRSDAGRLQQRLLALMTAWESDQASDKAATGADDPPLAVAPAAAIAPQAAASLASLASPITPAAPIASAAPVRGDNADWPPLVAALEATVRSALPADEPVAADLAARLALLAQAVAADGALPQHVAAITALCDDARRLLGNGHRVLQQLTSLCQDLGGSLGEVAEDDSWIQGQCRLLQDSLQGAPSLRQLRSAAALLHQTRSQQQRLRGERQAARDAFKQLLHSMLAQVGELGEHTGRFQQQSAQHAQAIEKADSLQSLAGVVKALLDDTRNVQAAVAQSHNKLQAERAQAAELQTRVLALESELRRLSDEVSTDMLTQVANRRGLMQAFDAESARSQREGGSALAVGLIDIDNFKRLNDSLGHAAGDVALKALAAAVRERLRPVDHLARFGGEEFVVLLPGATVVEACEALTRLQRSLTEALFLHEGREVFVTFSAGVTAWRSGEALQPALERADEGLYEAKRSGKNRTCAA